MFAHLPKATEVWDESAGSVAPAPPWEMEMSPWELP